MTREEAIQEACSIVALAFRSLGDYSNPSDGFCSQCPAGKPGSTWNYQNAGIVLDYVRRAVVDQLKRQGHAIDKGFDPVTGREIRSDKAKGA